VSEKMDEMKSYVKDLANDAKTKFKKVEDAWQSIGLIFKVFVAIPNIYCKVLCHKVYCYNS
jgi:hypothetical protein